MMLQSSFKLKATPSRMSPLCHPHFVSNKGMAKCFDKGRILLDIYKPSSPPRSSSPVWNLFEYNEQYPHELTACISLPIISRYYFLYTHACHFVIYTRRLLRTVTYT